MHVCCKHGFGCATCERGISLFAGISQADLPEAVFTQRHVRCRHGPRNTVCELALGLLKLTSVRRCVTQRLCGAGMALATLFVTMPFVVRELIPILETMDLAEEEAARTMGASDWQVFWSVTLPNIRYGLLYGIVLTNAVSDQCFMPLSHCLQSRFPASCRCSAMQPSAVCLRCDRAGSLYGRLLSTLCGHSCMPCSMPASVCKHSQLCARQMAEHSVLSI